LDGIAAMIILVPVLEPIASGVYQIQAVQFGVIVVLTLVIGLVTPPVGASLYIAAGIAKVSPWKLFISVLPYLFVALALVILLCFYPGIANFWF
ncbi:MAG: TRAP transporter large permease subunit, partial [Pseudohongiellaceae bacterium]